MESTGFAVWPCGPSCSLEGTAELRPIRSEHSVVFGRGGLRSAGTATSPAALRRLAAAGSGPENYSRLSVTGHSFDAMLHSMPIGTCLVQMDHL